MDGFKVSDEYRTNPLSLKPGGHEIQVSYSGGKFLVYDKVKYPGAYIKNLEESGKNSKYGVIVEVRVDNIVSWSASDAHGRKPWELSPFKQQEIPFDTDIDFKDDLPF
jgi:hypothetical protein